MSKPLNKAESQWYFWLKDNQKGNEDKNRKGRKWIKKQINKARRRFLKQIDGC